MPFEGEGWQPMFDGKTQTGRRETAFAAMASAMCLGPLIVLNLGVLSQDPMDQ